METAIVGAGMWFLGLFIGLYAKRGRGRMNVQVMDCEGNGNVVIQSGCKAGGDLVGGDLIKKGGAGRCKYCGAAQ